MDLLHQLGIERAIFAGAAAGALVSLRAALQAPDRVRGLLLFDLPDGDAGELDRIDELDIPTLLLQANAPGALAPSAVRELADAVRDLRGVHLFDGDTEAAATARAAEVDPLVRDYLESLPA
jgi:pimeloyl-ACP methyl ester carboxylesterase